MTIILCSYIRTRVQQGFGNLYQDHANVHFSGYIDQNVFYKSSQKSKFGYTTEKSHFTCMYRLHAVGHIYSYWLSACMSVTAKLSCPSLPELPDDVVFVSADCTIFYIIIIALQHSQLQVGLHFWLVQLQLEIHSYNFKCAC